MTGVYQRWIHRLTCQQARIELSLFIEFCETCPVNFLDEVSRRANLAVPAILAARQRSEEQLGQIRAAVAGIEAPGTAVIVTGSLGRGEVTSGSDVDWFLLVDGASDPHHLELLTAIQRQFSELKLKKPGTTGTFGNLVSSHDLVHYIAGTRDTNENLTRRVLLLAESRAVSGEIVRRRVIGNILARYVIHDRVAPAPGAERSTIPHFLLNDMVRYWRTMASDYASKMWERRGDGWATRNIKLRFSRKLILVWGLLACFSWDLFADERSTQVVDDDAWLSLLADHIREQTDLSPLEMLARILLAVDDAALSAKILGGYDHFLATLDDEANRQELEALPFEAAASSPVFQALRELSRQFRDGVNDLFFAKHETLTTLIRKYGVF